MATATEAGARARRQSSLRAGLGGFLGILTVQFWLGTWVNLFVQIPRNHPGANPPEYFSGVVQSVSWAIVSGPSPWLLVHALLGLLLTLGAIGLFVRAIFTRSRGLMIALGLGALAVLGAGFNGGSYLNYNHDFSSMLMATGFAIAAVCYTVALVIARS